jgi:hypothetical protein
MVCTVLWSYINPRSRVFLEKLIVTHLVKKLLAFYETPRFIAVHCCQFWARWEHPISIHPLSLGSILILASNKMFFSPPQPYASINRQGRYCSTKTTKRYFWTSLIFRFIKSSPSTLIQELVFLSVLGTTSTCFASGLIIQRQFR